MTLAQLMTEVDLEYSRIAGCISPDQTYLVRKAHIPALKGSAIGDIRLSASGLSL